MRPLQPPYLTLVSENFMKRDFMKAQELSLSKINSAIEKIWNCGENVILGWNYGDNYIDIAFSPIDHAVKNYEKLPIIFQGSRNLSSLNFSKVCTLLNVKPERIFIPCLIGDSNLYLSPETINNLIKRYCVSYSENRAIILFDIVKFSLNSPLEQLVQLKKLEHYINKAEKILTDNKILINLCRSTTGDGYYIWNHDTGPKHDMVTFMAFSLIIIFNELSETKIPLRSVFTIGSHFTFHQIDKNVPRGSTFVVGVSTITAARIINECLENQILISATIKNKNKIIDSVNFVKLCEDSFIDFMYNGKKISLFGISFSGSKNVQKYVIYDKHNFPHEVYNVRLNAIIDDQVIMVGMKTADIKLQPLD